MNSKLSGQPSFLAAITEPLKYAEQVDETWLKHKTWFCTQDASKSPRPSRGSSWWPDSIHRCQHLMHQSRLLQIQAKVTSQCAIAVQQQDPYPPSPGEAANQIDQLKDTFLSSISHELRTPISTIKMAVQMLTLALSREGLLTLTGKPSLSSNKIAHYLKILNDECNREISLITDLLDLQRLEATIQPINIQPIVLEPYLHRILRSFEEQAQAQQLTLVLDIPPELPVLTSDAQVLERILVELLKNACKFTPPAETIRISLGLIASDHCSGQTCVFQVYNSGVELPPEHLSQIFEKFYRIPKSDPNRYAGTGLGLALVQKLVAQLGGTIRVESANQQTCFWVELPVNSEVRLSPLASAAAPAG